MGELVLPQREARASLRTLPRADFATPAGLDPLWALSCAAVARLTSAYSGRFCGACLGAAISRTFFRSLNRRYRIDRLVAWPRDFIAKRFAATASPLIE